MGERIFGRAERAGAGVREELIPASEPVRCREAGNFPTPRIIQDREEFLGEQCELRNSGEG